MLYEFVNREVKNKRNLISTICVGTIYCNIHVLNNGKLNSHKQYHKSIIDTCNRVRNDTCNRKVHVLNNRKLNSHKHYHKSKFGVKIYVLKIYSQSEYIYSKYVLHKLDCVEQNYDFPHENK